MMESEEEFEDDMMLEDEDSPATCMCTNEWHDEYDVCISNR